MKPENLFPRVLEIFRQLAVIDEATKNIYLGVKELLRSSREVGIFFELVKVIHGAVSIATSMCLEIDSSVEALA